MLAVSKMLLAASTQAAHGLISPLPVLYTGTTWGPRLAGLCEAPYYWIRYHERHWNA